MQTTSSTSAFGHDPKSRSERNITRSVVGRLQQTGFKRVVRKPLAFGVAFG